MLRVGSPGIQGSHSPEQSSVSFFSPLPDLNSLTLEQQVAQMVIVRASGHLFDHEIRYPAWEPTEEVLRQWVEMGVGGIILLGGSAAEIALKTQRLQSWATVPLLIAADIEEGVGQRFSGATIFPPPMALSAIAHHYPEQATRLAQVMGLVTAQEALAIGINWVLAPVCDVNNNAQNPVINVRAFGETPETVSQLAIAFLQGAQQHPVLTCAKHFPGHGDTATDSHLELPLITHASQRLAAVEIPPFKAAIAAGVDSVMSAHLLIPAWDERHPATLSHRILTGELRQHLGFTGLIVTDALVMGAIAQRYGVSEAPVMAVEAGADILMMPIDPEAAIQAVCEAVQSGRIPRSHIEASVRRIWQAKQKIVAGLLAGDTTHRWELTAPPMQLDQLARPESMSIAGEILQQSMQIQAAPGAVFPTTAQPWQNVIVVDSVLECGLHPSSPAIALPQESGCSVTVLDRHTSPDAIPLLVGHRPALLQLFVRGNPFRGSAGLTQVAQNTFQALLAAHQLKALLVYGSPYLLQEFLPHLPAGVSTVFTYGQADQAQAIALQAWRQSLSIPE